MTILKANTDDDEILTDITKKSKAYWGYTQEQIDMWSELLTITKSYIENNHVFKLVINNTTLAYYSYCYLDNDTVKLDNLFVLPAYIGSGFGKLLMHDFIDTIKKTERKKIVLDSEPNAQAFYEKFGFIQVGQMKTSIKDRYLPIMELTIVIGM
ncbi:MAG: GNAT family N-acetyltransferase [Bacteroidota bacterium]